MTGSKILSISNLSKRYFIGAQKSSSIMEATSSILKGPKNTKSEFWALKDVSFDVEQGEVVGIIGKNGAGKSTLLKILSRITPLTSGRVEIQGRMASLLEVGTGFHAELTGLQNIYLNGAILGMKRQEIKNKIDEIIDFAGISQFIHTPVKHYSSGMYVRLAFAVAAHLEPEILLIDEVLAVGDIEFQKKSLGKMQQVSQSEGRTLLFVSHQMNFVSKLCSRVILMEKGQAKDFGKDVSGGINEYFTDGNSSHKGIWVPSKQEDGDYDVIAVKRFGFFHDREVVESIHYDNASPIHLDLVIDIKVLSSDLELGIILRTMEGATLFQSYHYDQEESKWPTLTEGSNRLRIEIPPRLLNEGEYSVQLIAGLRNVTWFVGPGADHIAVNFSISGGLSDSPLWHQKRDGLFAPVISWHDF